MRRALAFSSSRPRTEMRKPVSVDQDGKQQPVARQNEDRATVFVAAEAHVRRGLEPSGGGIEHFGTRIDAFVVTLVRTASDEDSTIVKRDAVMLVADAHLSRLLKPSCCR